MAGILIGILSVALVLLCGFIVLIILMQRPNANSGMGAALGGGAAEQAFGGQTTNVLTKSTIFSIIAFFVICLGLYLWMISRHTSAVDGPEGPSLSGIAAEAGATGDEAPAGQPEAVPAEDAPAAPDTVETLDMGGPDDAVAPAPESGASVLEEAPPVDPVPQPANP